MPTPLPTPLLRHIDRVREGRRVRRATALCKTWTAANGTAVVAGPFAGLRYPPDVLVAIGDGVAKLAGTYELEVHQAVAALVARQPRTVINIGGGEGYFAVGLKLRLPDADVIAYEGAETTRARLAAVASLNEVGVDARGWCDAGTLATEHGDAEDVALLVDVDGGERDLIDPAIVPAMARWFLIVELHEYLDADLEPLLRGRLEATHELAIEETRPRDPAAHPSLAPLTGRDAVAAMDEFRPAPQRWLVATPR